MTSVARTHGHASGGERLDPLGSASISLAHEVLRRFPELDRRYRFVAGGAAIPGSLVALASAAVARRVRAGASPRQAVRAVTVAEINAPPLISDRVAPMALAS